MTEDVFVEVEATQRNRFGEDICGDAFKTLRVAEEGRVIAVLSDGLGHGVKASILSLMTATMALKYTANDTDIVRAAEVIMDALPVCQVRKISYATFTVVDIQADGATRVVEMDNPPIILLRDGHVLELDFEEVASPRYNERVIRVYNLDMSIFVDTPAGSAVITGFCVIRENLFPPKAITAREMDVIPPGTCVNTYAAYDILRRIRDAADIVIPLHEPSFATGAPIGVK